MYMNEQLCPAQISLSDAPLNKVLDVTCPWLNVTTHSRVTNVVYFSQADSLYNLVGKLLFK